MDPMRYFYFSAEWDENYAKFVKVEQYADDPDGQRWDPWYRGYAGPWVPRRKHDVLRFLDLPKEVRLLIYELIFGSRIIYLNWYDSVYQWNEGRRFFYSAPRMAAGLIEPQNHLRLLEGFQQPVTQLPGFPPHPDFPWVQLSLLGTCRQIYEEAREIPFKKNIFVALSALPYAAFCNKIFLPLQTSSIKFLTIVINAGFHVGPNLRHWYDRRVQPLPNLTSVLFITRIRIYDDFDFDFVDTAGPNWWTALSGSVPISAEHVHKIPNVFRLLAHSNSGTSYEVSVDDSEVEFLIQDRDKVTRDQQFKSILQAYDDENAAELDEEGFVHGSQERFKRCVLGLFSLREVHKEIYKDGFRRRLDEPPTSDAGKPNVTYPWEVSDSDSGADDDDTDGDSESESDDEPDEE
ncbi:hypothetical protein HDK64DRAFT_60441 [Phyllosticta capitalensis]|uniref:Uncharacterized protein n=1 Tax=Phyllosticta capitalensis TaxID=121624 RepID=A0ABR1Y9R6_9PEZI